MLPTVVEKTADCNKPAQYNSILVENWPKRKHLGK